MENNPLGAQPLPEYHCKRIDRPLEVTGRMDDPIWGSAQRVTLVDAVSGAQSAQVTMLRLMHTDTTLYAGFECEDGYVWGTLTDRDSEIYNEECVEMFLCPSGKLRQYYEINLSPLNTVFDALILNGRQFYGSDRTIVGLTQYDCEGLGTMVHVDGSLGLRGGSRGWTAELAVPFASLIGHDKIVPGPCDEWRANFYRIDSPEPGNQVLSAWSPTGAKDFHRPWRFGRLIFE